MTIFIYLLFHNLVIQCTDMTLGCLQISIQEFERFRAAGLTELFFEIPLIIRIFRRKNGRT
jgi:hypothetical protein